MPDCNYPMNWSQSHPPLCGQPAKYVLAVLVTVPGTSRARTTKSRITLFACSEEHKVGRAGEHPWRNL